MPAGTVDLLLGGDLGLWALGRVSPSQVARVVTVEGALADAADAAGYEVEVGRLDELEPSAASVACSLHYPRLLRAETIARYQLAVNLHPGLLPFGRGWYPVFWALWEGSPAGATLHHIDAGVDEGPIIDQTRVAYDESDTGGSLHERVREAERRLFMQHWPTIAHGGPLPVQPQAPGGSYHSRAEFAELKSRAPWTEWDAARLLRLARCLTFPGHSGAEVELGGRSFSLELREGERA